MAHTATHYGCHSISGTALITAINSVAETISGMFLIPVGNGSQIAVIGVL